MRFRLIRVLGCTLMLGSWAPSWAAENKVSPTHQANPDQKGGGAALVPEAKCRLGDAKAWGKAYDDCVDRLLSARSDAKLVSLPQEKVGSVCPNYSQLDKNKRLMFIQAYLKAWAMTESGGRDGVIRMDEQLGTRMGLFMLREVDIKGGICKASVNPEDVLLDSENSIDCALSILESMEKLDRPLVKHPGYVDSLAKTRPRPPYFLDHPVGRTKLEKLLKTYVPHCF